MKNMILATLISLSSTAALADTTLFKCVVPVEQGAPSVSFTVVQAADESVDFITMTLVEGGITSQYFNQLDKGEVAQQIKAGAFNMLAITEKTAQVAGVIKNTGIISMSFEQGQFSGLFIANGNIYPIQCQSGK